MRKFILARKLEMTQVFDEEGRVIPVTLLEAGPVFVTQIKPKEKDGYEAVQLGFGNKSAKRISKPQKGHFKNLGHFRYVREFRIREIPNSESQIPKVGDKIDVSIFEKGDIVDVVGISKGKGFQGVVKRHGFHGGPKTHGTKHSHRAPGSIGATHPQHVIKGRKMAGHMGAERVTIKNLKVVGVDPEKNRLFIMGAVPGTRGTLVMIKLAKHNSQ